MLGNASLALGAPFGWAGGWNNYSNTGVSASIETADPYSPSPGYSSAYVMTDQVFQGSSQYIQIGWTKDFVLTPNIRYFWEWSNDWTGGFAQSYWGSPSVGSTHSYKLYVSSASSWIFMVDGVGITSMPYSKMTYAMDQIQFFGETSDYYHNRYPGSTSNPCSFSNGKYLLDGTWYKAYYYREADTYGASTANNNSSSFTINDTR